MQLTDQRGYVSLDVFEHIYRLVRQSPQAADRLIAATADLIRHNTLLSVARAGTGHLGASLSMAELMAELYFRRGLFTPANRSEPERDMLVLSKGHAAPGHYATLASRGYIDNARLDRLRRWNGLPGHSHVTTPGVDANTGSLAMGMSKAVGYAIAKQRFNLPGNVFTVVGDGELQEGQIWEAALSAASFDLTNFYLLIDVNEVQTDQYVDDILRYHDLAATFTGLGFAVAECQGNSPESLRTAFDQLANSPDKPRCLLAHTLKGAGVSYMEHPLVLKEPGARYVWHNKAPNSEQLTAALDELVARVSPVLVPLGIEITSRSPLGKIPVEKAAVGIEGKPLVPAYTEALLQVMQANERVVVFDADLEEDCGLTPVREAYPDRFVEIGIMEQHMCTTAAAFTSLGYVPVINSYAAFLSSRSNEQIYNLASDKEARFLLVGHLTGVIPATPGMSHQAFRDIGVLRTVPGLQMYQPMGPDDTKHILARYQQGDAGGMLYVRLSAAPSAVQLPAGDPALPIGCSQVIRPGRDAVILSAGPVMLGEALAAAELLAAQGYDVEVRNHPWLVEFDTESIGQLAARNIPVVVAEDHYLRGGLGEGFFAAVTACGQQLAACDHVALTDLPDTGFRQEALEGMQIDRKTIAARVAALLGTKHRAAAA